MPNCIQTIKGESEQLITNREGKLKVIVTVQRYKGPREVTPMQNKLRSVCQISEVDQLCKAPLAVKHTRNEVINFPIHTDIFKLKSSI